MPNTADHQHDKTLRVLNQTVTIDHLAADIAASGDIDDLIYLLVAIIDEVAETHKGEGEDVSDLVKAHYHFLLELLTDQNVLKGVSDDPTH